MRELRPDIQALRGLAVLLILFFHAGAFNVSAGYLGVDIFFVISGFLITGMIMCEMETGAFTFRRFYSRRIRRLLPAAYVVLATTIVASFFLLTEAEFNSFQNQVLGSVTFTSNIVFWRDINYFNSGAHLKPLLHFWSLSVEEQFYLLVPIGLFLLPRKLWGGAIIIGLVVSLALCLYLAPANPMGAFYLLPTRAWEFGIGCLGGYMVFKGVRFYLIRWMIWPSLAALLTMPFLWQSQIHPGMGAVIVCIATIIIVLANSETIKTAFPTRALARIGDISYSLYLVHWPLFAFANNMYLEGEIPPAVRAGLLLLSFALAAMLYRVEERYRHASAHDLRKLIAGLGIASILLIGAPYALGPYKENGYAQRLESNVGIGEDCQDSCVEGVQPDVMLWGDSFAMHLGVGIKEHAKNGMVQVTMHACAPVLGLSHVTPPLYNKAWAKECIAHNDKAMEILDRHPSITTIVLSSPLISLTDPQSRVLTKKDGESAASVDLALKKFRQTVDYLHSKGKKVVLVSPPPQRDYNIALCSERKLSHLPTLGPNKDCPAELETTIDLSPFLYGFLSRVEKESDLPLIDLTNYLCENGTCRTMWDDAILYKDASHLSIEGTQTLFRKANLMDEIYARAR